MSEQFPTEQRPPRTVLERILGERPLGLVVRLVLMSLFVGFIMQMLGFDARDVVEGGVQFLRETFRDGSGVLNSMAGYVLTGAALVVPIWFIMRLAKGRK